MSEVSKRFYVTTPLYYVNDEPHIGHAYTTLLADVFTRYHKLLGHDTYFLTGTDEHGQKVETSAKKRGVTPIQHCDEMSQRFKDLFKTLNFEYDRFIRTTEPDHIALVQKMLNQLWEKSKEQERRGELPDLYAKDYEGLYYVSDEIFVTDDKAEEIRKEKPNAEIVSIRERNYFFRMSAYQQRLIDYINEHPTFVQPDFRKNEVLGFLRQPLNDLCISRPKSRLAWGIELPFDTEYVCYVWFDALLNYVSGAKGGLEGWKEHPADLQLVGKDILTQHCVYWPTMLMALDLPLPKMVFAHGWWLIGGEKMSKSVGNVIRPLELIDKLGGVENGGVDAMRHLLTRGMILGQDATLTEDRMKAIVNGELANDLGNLLSRVAKLLQQHFDSRIPDLPADPTQFLDEECMKESLIVLTIEDAILEFEKNDISQGFSTLLSTVWRIVNTNNKFFDSKSPWALVKTNPIKASEVFGVCLLMLNKVSVALYPVMPEKMKTLRAILANNRIIPTNADICTFVHTEQLLPFDKPLFPRIDFDKAFAQEEKVKQLKEKLVEVHEKLEDNLITIDEFKKAELRVAEILKAERIEKATKLLLLQLDDGNGAEHPRQIVAGIAEHYAPEVLVGQKIVIVSNLKPAKLKGHESNGMLLAAKADGKLVLVTVAGEIANGASVG